MYIGLHVNYRLFLSGCNETWISLTDFQIKFHKNPSSGSSVVPRGWTDRQIRRMLGPLTFADSLFLCKKLMSCIVQSGWFYMEHSVHYNNNNYYYYKVNYLLFSSVTPVPCSATTGSSWLSTATSESIYWLKTRSCRFKCLERGY